MSALNVSSFADEVIFQMPKKKHSFDAEEYIQGVLDVFEKDESLKRSRWKGRFINICIRLAKDQAFSELKHEVGQMGTALESASDTLRPAPAKESATKRKSGTGQP